MRPPRIAILVLFFAATLFLFCRSITSIRRTAPIITPATPQRSTFRSFFSFTAPFTLFPPNAAISLFDDNSTFFPARPAAFGPNLPSNGLSGQLWIGSGFADENLADGEGEGELGCSDLAGFEEGLANLELKTATNSLSVKSKAGGVATKGKNSKRDGLPTVPAVDRTAALDLQPQQNSRPEDDGTDDYLHQGLSPKAPGREIPPSGTSHADIQSIQETAEITGKIVLLSRGGCGFLEKVKWAQRRGAIALIVGDNQKGGPLIQMFARGDTSNVTIPAIFTSRTTAHLLSSLMQPGSFIEDILDENGNPVLKVQQSDKVRKKGKQPATAIAAPAPKKTTVTGSSTGRVAKKNAEKQSRKALRSKSEPSWLSRLFTWGRHSGAAEERSRPPSSGQLDWVLVEDWSDEKDKIIKNSLEKASGRGGESQRGEEQGSGDGFQIGVQDWRDPDLVESSGSSQGSNTGVFAKTGGNKDNNGPEGGSITPGSGEYSRNKQAGSAPIETEDDSSSSGGLMSKIFGDDDGADFSNTRPQPDPIHTPIVQQTPPADKIHEGLWITITPTGSATPFFDTLLVLVISPLITLCVVYALLLLRARIRRRRWRAPKSVVERLPVRTYHTVASTPSLSPRLPSPHSSSPTTPLLQGSSRPRPRSRTTTGIPDADDLLRVDSALQVSRSPSREKTPHASSQWKKYMGRQVECVVCLEEYIDGVSQVMSLPCGHEFHVECM